MVSRCRLLSAAVGAFAVQPATAAAPPRPSASRTERRVVRGISGHRTVERTGDRDKNRVSGCNDVGTDAEMFGTTGKPGVDTSKKTFYIQNY
jgi:hypothetical protein